MSTVVVLDILVQGTNLRSVGTTSPVKDFTKGSRKKKRVYSDQLFNQHTINEIEVSLRLVP